MNDPIARSHRSLAIFSTVLSFSMASSVILAAGLSLAESPAVTLVKNEMMPARDGVRLATDIYLPAGEGQAGLGRFPAILIRTPYGKGGVTSTAEFFAHRGYAVVVQDVRGRYESEGDFYIYVNEGEDGYDAVQWVGRQKWCNGEVGTYGQSYLAATQNALAVHKPRFLKTMFVMVGTSNYVEDGAGRGGAFALLHNMAYSFRLAFSGKEARKDPKVAVAIQNGYDHLADWLLAAPLKSNSPLEWAPSYRQWYADWRRHATYDEYWKKSAITLRNIIPAIRIFPFTSSVVGMTFLSGEP